MDLHTALIIAHIIGTILGVGGATIAEINLITALKDGVIDTSDKALMHANYAMLRIGTIVVVLSGMALVMYHVLILGNEWPLTSDKVWFKDMLVLIIVTNAVLLAKRRIPLWLGSALSFTSWWMATILGAWRGQPYSFIELLFGYVGIVLLVAGILEYIRRRYITIR